MTSSEPIRISYSSSNTFQGCKRKFYYDKVVKIDHDPDFVDNAKALRVGKAFHMVIELCAHMQSNFSNDILQKSFAENKIDDPTEQGLIWGMAIRYLKLHSKSNLKAVGMEIQIGDPQDYIGFIDAVMTDIHDNWWIVDLKTAGKLNNSLLSRLSRDPQLNIYAYYTNQVAKLLGLDVSKFAGVRYRVTTKATIKCSVKETMKDFAKRVYDRVESYDIGIPAKDLDSAAVYRQFMTMLVQMRGLKELEEEDVPQNFNFCESFFKPCPYWSNCYGQTFSDSGSKYCIFDSENIPNLTKDVVDIDESLDFL